MATLVSNKTGNFTDPSLWSVCEPISLLDFSGNISVYSTSTTAFSVSPGFTTVGAVTIDGIGIFISRVLINNGNISVALHTGAATVAGTSVTVNIPDFSNNNLNEIVGYVFFKFDAPVTLAAATTYAIKTSTNVAATIQFPIISSAFNMPRFLRTTTTQAPASGDTFIFAGSYVNPAFLPHVTHNINYNQTVNVTYHHAAFSRRAILTFSTAAGTYYMKFT